MMKLIVSLTLLWAICSSVGALQCQSCTDAECLSVTTVTCASETMCIRATIKARTLSNTKEESYKACAASSLCPTTGNRTFEVNSGLSSAVTLAECCNTDNCNAGTLPAPSQNQTKNGLTCHFCATSSICDTQIDCEGFEDRCYRATVISGGRTPTVGGCISTNLVEASSSLQTTPLLLNVGMISGSLGSCSSILCIDLTAPPVTTATPNPTSHRTSESTTTTPASATAAPAGSGASTTISSGSTKSVDAGYLRVVIINLLLGLFTVILF